MNRRNCFASLTPAVTPSLSMTSCRVSKWKGNREKFEREHENELRTFHMARWKLDKHRFPAGKISVHAWEQEQTKQKCRENFTNKVLRLIQSDTVTS